MTDVTGGKTVEYANGQNYDVNGGTLQIDPGFLGLGTISSSATIGNAGGNILINLPAGSVSLGNINLVVGEVPAGSKFEITFKNPALLSNYVTESYSSATNTTVVSVPVGGGTVAVVITGNPFSLANGSVTKAVGGLGGSFVVCYLRGSMIATPDGEVAVEDLRAGDLVLDFVSGKGVSTPLVWTGQKSIVVRDRADFPVCIRAGAIAEGVPAQDLFVTSEHAMAIEGRFVPARMLVNGQSIVYMTDMDRFDAFHVETARHAVLRASGALSESYLDTGNRSSFGSASTIDHDGNVVYRAFRHPQDWSSAALPLCTDVSFVQPIHEALARRAETLGYEKVEPAYREIGGADLKIRDAAGRDLDLVARDGEMHTYRVPAGVSQLHVSSRTARPSEVVGSFLDDRRDLGVLFGEGVTVFDGHTRPLTSHLTAESAVGWSAPEPGQRWTTGEAILDLGEAPKSDGLLTIKILHMLPVYTDEAVAAASEMMSEAARAA